VYKEHIEKNANFLEMLHVKFAELLGKNQVKLR